MDSTNRRQFIRRTLILGVAAAQPVLFSGLIRADGAASYLSTTVGFPLGTTTPPWGTTAGFNLGTTNPPWGTTAGFNFGTTNPPWGTTAGFATT